MFQKAEKKNSSLNIIASLIIPVFNEENYICDCLDSLIKQTYSFSNIEVLIIDGMSNDSTLDLVKNYFPKLPIRILINEKRKVTYALNIGIENSRGKYIIRLDGHSVYNNDYLEKCLFYLETIDCDNVGGIAITKGKGIIGEVNADILSSKFGVGGSRFRTSTKSGYVDTVPFGAFKKDVFCRIGLFNTDLPRSEDNDINSRIWESGGKVYLASDIRFTYYCRNTFFGLLKQALQNGNALFFTVRKNNKAMKIRHFVPLFFVLSLIVFIPLSFFFPVIRYIFFVELIAYFLLDIFFSLFFGKKKYFFLKLLFFPAFHISYGLGSILGMFFLRLY